MAKNAQEQTAEQEKKKTKLILKKDKNKNEHKNEYKAVPELVKDTLNLGEVAPPFSKEQVMRIINHSAGLGQKMMMNLLAIEISNSFEVLGYDNMKELIETHFNGKYKSIHHNLTAARVAYSIGGPELIEKYPDDAMRAMKNLDVVQRKEVFNLLLKKQNATKDTVNVTIKMVKAAIKKLYPHKLAASKSKGTNWRKVIEKKADKFFEDLLDKVDEPLTLLAATIQSKLRPEQLSELLELIQKEKTNVLSREGI